MGGLVGKGALKHENLEDRLTGARYFRKPETGSGCEQKIT